MAAMSFGNEVWEVIPFQGQFDDADGDQTDFPEADRIKNPFGMNIPSKTDTESRLEKLGISTQEAVEDGFEHVGEMEHAEDSYSDDEEDDDYEWEGERGDFTKR